MTEPDLYGNLHDGSFVGGAGSPDLVSDSTDPGELRALLTRARERLSFYEGFDRLIAENIRHSGELMLEALSMRENVAASVGLGNQQQRERILARLADLDSGIDAIQVHLTSLAAQIAELQQSLGGDPQGTPAQAPPPAQTPERASAASFEPETTSDREWGSAKVIDVIAHHVPKAATALSLQRHLGDLDAVVGVEAREFAEGVLRMQVTARQPLAESDVTGWTGGGPVRILQIQPHVIEIDLGHAG